MAEQLFVASRIPERFVEVDAARLLLILTRFAKPITDAERALSSYPPHPVVRCFTPEYYLQKLDFLLCNPGYFAYEMLELHRLGKQAAADRNQVAGIVRSVLAQHEPDLRCQPYRKFWQGAYQRIDDVQIWWYSHGLVYTRLQVRGEAPPQKHYFLAAEALSVADLLVEKVDHARWYYERIQLLHRFFGAMAASEIKKLQYAHRAYREAQINEDIPNLTDSELREHFQLVIGEPLDETTN